MHNIITEERKYRIPKQRVDISDLIFEGLVLDIGGVVVKGL